MKKLSILAICVAATSAFAYQGSTKSTLMGIYNKLDSLSVKKDMTGLTKLLKQVATKDCFFITGKGEKQTVEKALSDMSKQMKVIVKFMNSTTHIDTLTTKGSMAVARVSSSYKLTSPIDPSGTPHLIESSQVSEDTWVKVGADWKLKSSKTLKENTKIDGKVVSGM